MSFPSPQLPGTHPGRTSLSLYNQSSYESDGITTCRISDDDSLAVFTTDRDRTTGSLATEGFWSWWDTQVRQPFVKVDEAIKVRVRKLGHISPQDQNEMLRDIRALSDGLINFVEGFSSNRTQEVTLDRNMTDNTMDVGHSSDIVEIARTGNAEHESNFSPLHVNELDFDILLPALSDPSGFLTQSPFTRRKSFAVLTDSTITGPSWLPRPAFTTLNPKSDESDELRLSPDRLLEKSAKTLPDTEMLSAGTLAQLKSADDSRAQQCLLQPFNDILGQFLRAYAICQEADAEAKWRDRRDQAWEKMQQLCLEIEPDLALYRPSNGGRKWHRRGGFFHYHPFAFTRDVLSAYTVQDFALARCQTDIGYLDRAFAQLKQGKKETSIESWAAQEDLDWMAVGDHPYKKLSRAHSSRRGPGRVEKKRRTKQNAWTKPSKQREEEQEQEEDEQDDFDVMIADDDVSWQ